MKAHYYQHSGEAILLDVVKQHDDGTVDLGAGETVHVSRVPVCLIRKHGHAVLQPDDAKAAAEAKAKGKGKASDADADTDAK